VGVDEGDARLSTAQLKAKGAVVVVVDEGKALIVLVDRIAGAVAAGARDQLNDSVTALHALHVVFVSVENQGCPSAQSPP